MAEALDAVAIACSPHRDLAVNPAKVLAIAIADTNPVVWGGSVLAARAARRVAESIRRATGRSVLAGDAEHLLPVIEATRPRDVFDDPFADGAGELRPMLLVLDDGAEDPLVREQRGRLLAAASWKPSFYGTPLVTWQPASGAAGYEVQWSKSAYPWRTAGSVHTGATSTTLPLKPGTWWYRVRGIDPSLPGNGLLGWSTQVPLQITPPTFSVAAG